MTAATLLLTLVTASRLCELLLSSRHEKALRARGGYEVGAAHYPALVTLHAAWLAGLWLIGREAPVVWFWVIIFLLLQIARFWTIAALGEHWTTRIILLPGASLVQRGPYRYVRHPNYMIVIGEIAALPLAFGLPAYALLFSLVNAIILAVRIKAENTALAVMRRASSPTA